MKEHISARSIYPNREQSKAEYDRRIQDGRIELEFVEKKFDLGAIDVDLLERYPDIDTTNFAEGYSNLEYDEVLELLTEEDKQRFIEAELRKTEKDAFTVPFAQNGEAWWLSVKPDQDIFPWLDTAELHTIFRITGGERDIIINDFSGENDPKELEEGMQDIFTRLAEHGVDISTTLSSINILPSDNEMFLVSQEIQEKHPDAYVAAVASKARGAIFFNEQMITKNKYRDQAKDGLIGGWGPTVVHELTHLFNMGLSDMDETYANEISWYYRGETITDDYGNLIKTNDGESYFGIKTITDDFGDQVRVTASQRPQTYLGPNITQKDKIQGPPSPYGATSSEEDIAESGATLIYKPEVLDEERTTMVHRLHAEVASDTVSQESIQINPVEIDSFNPWDVMKRKIRCKRAGYFIVKKAEKNN